MKYVLSSLVMPCADSKFVLECKKIDLNEAREFVRKGDFVSAVGHKSTAELLSKLLGVEIEANRVFVNMEKGDEAIAVQFLERIQEGKVLDIEEIEEMYHSGKIIFRYIKRID